MATDMINVEKKSWDRLYAVFQGVYNAMQARTEAQYDQALDEVEIAYVRCDKFFNGQDHDLRQGEKRRTPLGKEDKLKKELGGWKE